MVACASDLKPDPEELPKIEEKLKNGLPPTSSSAMPQAGTRAAKANSGSAEKKPATAVEHDPEKHALGL